MAHCRKVWFFYPKLGAALKQLNILEGPDRKSWPLGSIKIRKSNPSQPHRAAPIYKNLPKPEVAASKFAQHAMPCIDDSPAVQVPSAPQATLLLCFFQALNASSTLWWYFGSALIDPPSFVLGATGYEIMDW